MVSSDYLGNGLIKALMIEKEMQISETKKKTCWSTK